MYAPQSHLQVVRLDKSGSMLMTCLQDVLAVGDKIKAVILGMDDDFSRISLSTADLEEEAGDMTRDKVRFQGLGLRSSLPKTRCAPGFGARRA